MFWNVKEEKERFAVFTVASRLMGRWVCSELIERRGKQVLEMLNVG